MNGRRFIDTNVLIYAHDIQAGQKYVQAGELVTALWEERTGVVSTQVLQELVVGLRKRVAKSAEPQTVRNILTYYLSWHVVVNDGRSILEALDLEARYKVSFWDALILQAAHAADADILYSEDLSDGQHYGSVQVINPFRR